MLGPFHIAIYRKPEGDAPVSTSASRAFDVTFEEVCAAFEAWPRMFVEPDGSFVWVGAAAGRPNTWQLDGQLFDRAGKVLLIELKGDCPQSALEQILAVCSLTLEETFIEHRRTGKLSVGETLYAELKSRTL